MPKKNTSSEMKLKWEEFERVQMHIGTIINATNFKEARKPAIKLEIDFGPLGIKKSSAQITKHYQPDELIGRQVVAVLNFPPKQIGPFISECLVLGAVEADGGVVLLSPSQKCANGSPVA